MNYLQFTDFRNKSKDYFDKTIDGNFNVALAARQPGSTFKPFVYAHAFELGYQPETMILDARSVSRRWMR